MNQTDQPAYHFQDDDWLVDSLRSMLTVALAPRGVAPASLRILARWKAAGHKATAETNAALRAAMFKPRKAGSSTTRQLCPTKLAA